MAIYDPKSMKAEEFINDAEIRETLALHDQLPLILFSAEKGQGRDELLGCIESHI